MQDRAHYRLRKLGAQLVDHVIDFIFPQSPRGEKESNKELLAPVEQCRHILVGLEQDLFQSEQDGQLFQKELQDLRRQLDQAQGLKEQLDLKEQVRDAVTRVQAWEKQHRECQRETQFYSLEFAHLGPQQ